MRTNKAIFDIISLSVDKMGALKQEDRRKFAAQFWLENKHNDRPYVVKMLKKMGMKQLTIYDVLKRVNIISPTRRVGSGRPPKKIGPKKVAGLISSTVGKIRVSFRKLAKKFKKNDKMNVKEVLSRLGIYEKRRKINRKAKRKTTQVY
jgi:hypothetical protein